MMSGLSDLSTIYSNKEKRSDMLCNKLTVRQRNGKVTNYYFLLLQKNQLTCKPIITK